MSCQEARLALSRLDTGLVSVGPDLVSHLESCGACKAWHTSLGEVEDLLRSAPPPPPPPADIGLRIMAAVEASEQVAQPLRRQRAAVAALLTAASLLLSAPLLATLGARLQPGLTQARQDLAAVMLPTRPDALAQLLSAPPSLSVDQLPRPSQLLASTRAVVNEIMATPVPTSLMPQPDLASVLPLSPTRTGLLGLLALLLNIPLLAHLRGEPRP
jgi:hypothetical protein